MSQTEIILKKNKWPFNNQIWTIFHPLDLREKLQYKHIKDFVIRTAHRREYESIKSNGTTLIFYED